MTGEDGAATFVLHGALPGLTTLTATVDGTALSQAGRCSRVCRGSATGATGGDDWCDDVWCMVAQGELHYGAQGTKLELSAEDGTTIWYTTNDTCPCRDEGRVKYTEPIALDSNMYVRIAAQRPDMSYSEYSERLNITITVTDEAVPEPQAGAQADAWQRRAGWWCGWLWRYRGLLRAVRLRRRPR